MARPEPMDVDCLDNFDNKENTFHHNVPCTEKGYEELDVSELNMKLRYSMTPVSSPMSKSYTASPDSRYETGDVQNCSGENANLTRSLNSTLTKNDNVIKSLKSLPLQSLRTDQLSDGNGNASVFRQLDGTIDDANVTVTISGASDIDENVSLPSSSSSALHTPEATTPTKEIKDGASPIMRGLKSVLNMFRSSTSPVPPMEGDNIIVKQEVLDSEENIPISNKAKTQVVASTPLPVHRSKDSNTSKRSSPYKDSIVFNDDLEKELNWNDKKSSSPEINPIHKLLRQNSKTSESKPAEADVIVSNTGSNFHSIVEYMDISNDSIIQNITLTENQPDKHEVGIAVESDSEFVDCETTLSKNESYVLDIKTIQEKISPTVNLDKSQHTPLTTKNSEFLDCDSTFSKNESYVLDIKAIQEKISPIPNLDTSKHISKNESYVLDIKEIQEKITAQPNQDESKDCSSTTQNTPTVAVDDTINRDITSMSFTDKDLNLDMTMPSDYSDYSQATTEILSELEKLEGTSEVETNRHADMLENISEQKDVIDHLGVIANVTLESEFNKEENIEVTESHENHHNDTELKFDKLDTTLTEEKNANITESITPKINDDSNTIENKVQYNESFIESESKTLQSQEINPIQDNLDDGCKVLVETPFQITNVDQMLETTIIQDSNDPENKNTIDEEIISKESNVTPIAISSNLENTEPIEVSNVMHNDVKLSDNVNIIQNNIIPLEVVNNSHKVDVPLEALSVTQNDVIPELSVILPANLPLPNEFIEPPKSLDVTQNVTETQTMEVQITENPSDIPLPDDDIDKEAVVSEFPISHVETASSLISDTIMTLPELEVAGLVPERLCDILVENKIINSVLTSEAPGAQLSELQPAVNILSESSDVKTVESLSAIVDGSNDLAMLEFNNMSLKNDPYLPFEHPALANTDLNSTASEIYMENTSLTTLENKVNDNNMVSKVNLSCNITFNQTNDNVAANATQNIDESRLFTNDLNKNTVTLNNIASYQNASQIEPMDITMNENLNLTHELPDLVNQTIILADENMQCPVIANDTVNEPKQGENYTSDVKNIENLKTLENIVCVSDFETNSKTVLAELISASEDFILPETSLPTNDEKQPTSEAEIDQVNNMTMNSSDDQPPTIFTNTPDAELMEVEVPTADEEIIVSANNSPYVSLMSGVETVLENIEVPEKIEETKKIEEPNKIEDTFEDIENPFVTKTSVASSPPITSKGYNFNFDEIDDPFATKTKIRLSPPLDSPTKSIGTENVKEEQFKVPTKSIRNRRKSQPPERKKPALKKKFNTSFDVKSAPKTSTNEMDNAIIIGDTKDKTNICDSTELKQGSEKATYEIIEAFNTTETQKENLQERKELRKEEDQAEPKAATISDNTLKTSEEIKSLINSSHPVSSDVRTTSSSEQSTYYSAGTSSTESFQSKNVFNLPEIDDVNFNPFATKSKMRQSPPPDAEIDNPFATKSKIRSSPNASIIIHNQSDANHTVTLNESKLVQPAKAIDNEDKMETELMEKDTSANITNTTSSSRATDNMNLTTREVNTEDEDTVEGPFFDAGEDFEKITDFVVDNDDMMQFNELQDAAQANENNDGELFIDAEALEFLLNQNKSNVVTDSGKESLFLKFDPLFAKRISSDGVLASLNKAQTKQSTPTKPTRPSLRNEASPIAGPSTLNMTYECDNNISQASNEDANITVAKPMMVVTPALNPAVTPRNKPITPARSNRRSITFTSPAIAVIDRLLSMSANNSGLGHDTTITRTQSNGEQTEADLALTQLRELLAEKEISVYNLRTESKELKDRLSTMESQVRILEADGQERLKKINELNERLVEKTKTNKSMAAVVEEYERTIASLIADIEQDKKRNAEERIRLINERDEQTAHLSSMEVSFSDLHSKYEKSKQVILTCKANEDILKKTIEDFQQQVTKMQTNYEMLKQHATAKLNHANQELEKINRAHEAEVVKLNAMIKRNHMLATSLQETLAQKTKANDELTAICDELINKVGSK